eukprot:TRINITY_DN10633_c0_g2_i2.p1 TRINITY_DN10633_c0_g2~~TRINITY_DN10633_c0_g2_i2.p1  ORF type:complete len:325 (-),score=49.01 TRINITY_DN10633_c0_g2_i2:40-954(-)
MKFSGDLLEHATKFCSELQEIKNLADLLTKSEFPMSKIEKFVSRIVLYETPHGLPFKIQIRAHIFTKEAKEEIIHNHTLSFISCCLSGRYTHKIWCDKTKSDDPQKKLMHHSERSHSGFKLVDGEVEKPLNLSAQHFVPGTCYFIDHHALHTVEGNDDSVVTIVFRNLSGSGKRTSKFYHEEQEIPAQVAHNITDNDQKKKVVAALVEALALKKFNPGEVKQAKPETDPAKLNELLQNSSRIFATGISAKNNSTVRIGGFSATVPRNSPPPKISHFPKMSGTLTNSTATDNSTIEVGHISVKYS